jgi:hypothetical protein
MMEKKRNLDITQERGKIFAAAATDLSLSPSNAGLNNGMVVPSCTE